MYMHVLRQPLMVSLRPGFPPFIPSWRTILIRYSAHSFACIHTYTQDNAYPTNPITTSLNNYPLLYCSVGMFTEALLATASALCHSAVTVFCCV